jgi:NAD(P)-dependent dehydrogenase (short-subunit alcohol dehydrogenase family)
MKATMNQNRFDLADRVVIITSDASDIGRLYCEALVAAGGKAVLAEPDGGLATRVATALSTDGSVALGAGCDVSDMEAPK